MRFRPALPFSILLLVCAAGVSAQPAHLVRDLSTATTTGSAWISTDLTPFAGSFYFGAVSIGSAGELWSTAGTSETSRRLAEFDSPLGNYAYGMTALPGRLVFFAGGQVLAYDAATKEIAVIAEFPSVVASWAATPNALFFAADDGVHETELWRTDGTSTGTGMVVDREPGGAGSGVYGLIARGETIFYFVADLNGATQLWKSDGTPSGTAPVTGLPEQVHPVYFQANTAVVGSLVYFTAEDLLDHSRPYQIWRTDGTADGTFSVGEFAADSPGVCPGQCFPYGPSDLAALRNRVVFIANDGVHGREIWASDGTRAGTTMLRDIWFNGSALFFRTVAAGRFAYFTAEEPEHGSELWRTDGTPTGTTMVVDLVQGVESGYPGVVGAVGSLLVFITQAAHGFDLWESDGTESGTRRIAGIPGYPGYFAPLADGFLFVAPDGSGSNLWRSDGTESGTFPIERFATGSGSYPAVLTPLGERTSFSIASADGAHPVLWTSDGSADGTRPVREFDLMGGGFTARQSASFEGDLFFAAADDGQDMELWASDGTPEGTRLVRDVTPGPIASSPFGMTAALGRLFFVAWNGVRQALYSTDGTSEGTGPVSSAMWPFSEGDALAAAGDQLFLVADDGVHGAELWRTDGTGAGTTLVRDINPGANGSSVWQLAVLGDAVLFGAWDGSSFGLWRSDGTEAGTTRLRAFGYSIGPPTRAGNVVYFSNGEATELWASDGTESGTRRLATVVGAANLTAVGSTVFFSGDDGVHGPELWRSDGTEAGTFMVRDIRPGPVGSLADWSYGMFVAAGDRLLLSANDGSHGRELWASDGTAAGTEMLQDIAPGAASSRPASFVRAGDTVFFTADDGTTGVELWAVSIHALASAPRLVDPAGHAPKPTRELLRPFSP